MPGPLPLNWIYLSQGIAEPAFGATPDEFFYLKSADGRRSIYRQSTATGLAEALTTEPMPGGGVGYGGGTFAVRDGRLVFAARGGRLYGLDLASGEQWPISPAYEGVAAPAIAPGGNFVAFLAEQEGRCNVLLADARPGASQAPVRVSANPWYAFNPVFSPDGTHLAWMEWDELDMPWDECRLVVARLARPLATANLAAEALPVETRTLAAPKAAYASPQFSPDSQWLAYTSDETGWRSLWVTRLEAADLRGAADQVALGPGEAGGPDWVPGMIKARWSDDGRSIYAIRRHESRAHLHRVAWPEKRAVEIETGYSWINEFDGRGQRLILTGGRSTEPESLATLDTATGQVVRRVTSAVGLVDPAALIAPEVISWSTVGGLTTWGILYKGRAAEGQAGPRPLIVAVHGGPTSERGLTWDAQAQYFATRGWHYLQVNYRGSSGFGRAYQDLLNGRWGVVDVEDARSGAEHLVAAGLADPQRLVVSGGSAGGYTTLMALTQQPDFWTAGVAWAAVADMYELKQGSHRFEVNYEQTLIGRLPDAGPLWRARSPLTHAGKVRKPVLLFHGRQDKAVPTQQSIDFADGVRRGGGTAELVLYDDEGHVFAKEATRRDMIEKMERFLDKYVINRQGIDGLTEGSDG